MAKETRFLCKMSNQILASINGVIGTLLNKLPGDIWGNCRVEELKQSIEKRGSGITRIESVAIHDAIKAGTEERDPLHRSFYIQTIKNLSACGIHLIYL